jgi:phage shock protein PspC (stress-responsive transcriptional regulator)
MNCNDTMTALLATIESGDSIPDDVRAHLRDCQRCRALIASARALEHDVDDIHPTDAALDDIAAAASAQVVRSRRKSYALRIATTLVIVLAGSALIARIRELSLTKSLSFAFVSIAIAVTALIAATLMASMRTSSGRRVYRRLGKPQQLAGVCAGLGDAFGINVFALRVLFFFLFFFKGLGLLLYVTCAIMIPVDPADRQHMIGFQLRRLLRRMRQG